MKNQLVNMLKISRKPKRNENIEILRAQRETLDLTTKVYSELKLIENRRDSRVNPYTFFLLTIADTVRTLAV